MGKLSPASTRDLHISVAEQILNKEAGWKALTGTTDFGAIAAATPDTDPRLSLAFDLFVDRVCSFVGSYYVSLRGEVDALVFAGGIGERSARLRAAVVNQCRCIGFAIDEERNEGSAAAKGAGKDGGRDVTWEIGKPVERSGRTQRVLVVRTDEQLEMAHAAAEDTALWPSADGQDEDDEVADLTLLKVTRGHD